MNLPIGDLTGEFNTTLDDKGRVSLPSRLREELPGNTLKLTKGMMVEHCLWLFTPEHWNKTAERLQSSETLTVEKLNVIQHLVIAPAVWVEIDKIGRIAVPQRLRDFAGLNKDCVVIGMANRIEIWDIGRYETYCENNKPNLKDILEEMGPASLLF